MTGSGAELAAKASKAGGAGKHDKEPILDEAHLQRTTLGDRGLEREVLQIFVRQSAIMLGRIADGERVAAAAHTLTGSARGIGAWRVARAAERLERASGEGSEEKLSQAIADLEAASLEASAAIGVRLGDPSH
jgi:HPt (histidine-containing phosphotransfer) domain-containing protein